LIQEHIALGHTPFFINATAGTTVLGAFDPIRPCGEIAQRYNCWLHVDGSWGGAVVFVPELAKTLLDGSELVSHFWISHVFCVIVQVFALTKVLTPKRVIYLNAQLFFYRHNQLQ